MNQGFREAVPHGSRTKEDIDGQEAARAARNYLYSRVTNPAPAAANSGSVVAATTFTPRVSGNVRALVCLSGVVSVNSNVTITLAVGAQTFTFTAAPGLGSGIWTTTLNIGFDHLFTGLVVGTQVNVTCTWAVAGGVQTLTLGAGAGSVFLQELPN